MKEEYFSEIELEVIENHGFLPDNVEEVIYEEELDVFYLKLEDGVFNDGSKYYTIEGNSECHGKKWEVLKFLYERLS